MLEMIYLFVLLFSFYAIVKLVLRYRKTHDSKYVIASAIVLLISTDLWMRAYGIRLQAFIDNFRFVITFLPLVVFLIYSYLDTQRHKESKSKEMIKGAFKQYVAPAVIEDMLKDPKKLKLGGQKKNLTVMFSDIRGFTTLSEKLSPEKLVHLLNDYLSHMTGIILKTRGVVDKFIGDAIMAIWGAPIDDAFHPKKACLTALEMLEKLKPLQKEWKKQGLDLDIGIGINTGDMVVGNMGSKHRFDYTVMGDAVNLGSRLEGTNKMYGTRIIVSQFTYERVKNDFVFRELDLVMVKGKKEPIHIYELVGIDASAKQKRFLKLFKEGLDAYRHKKWETALKHFKEAHKTKTDKTANIYISRCNDYKKKPPAKGWDGVYEMKTK